AALQDRLDLLLEADGPRGGGTGEQSQGHGRHQRQQKPAASDAVEAQSASFLHEFLNGRAGSRVQSHVAPSSSFSKEVTCPGQHLPPARGKSFSRAGSAARAGASTACAARRLRCRSIYSRSANEKRHPERVTTWRRRAYSPLKVAGRR